MDSSGSRAPRARPAATYRQVLEGPLLKSPLFQAIVGSFFSDNHVVDVALAQAGRGHAHELSALPQFLDRSAAAVAHSGAQAPDELIHQLGQQAFVRYAALDAFGHQLPAAFLRVAVGRALAHRAHRPHAAIALERAALIENRLAGTFFGARQQASDHHAVGARGDRLGDVAGKLDAAIRDQRHSAALRGLRAFGDRGDLGNSGAADHSSGADRSRPDADLDSIRSQAD